MFYTLLRRHWSWGTDARPLRGVGQDKGRRIPGTAVPVYTGSAQTTAETSIFTRLKPVRTAKPPKRRKTIGVRLWMDAALADDLKQLAKQQRLSVSATGTALLKHSLTDTITKQHAALLEPIIEQAISRRHSHLSKLLVGIHLQMVQVRQFVINILARQEPMLKMDEARLNHLRERAYEQSRQELLSRLSPLDTQTRAELLAWLDATTAMPDGGENQVKEDGV